MSGGLPAVLELSANRVWRTYLGGRTLDRWEGRGEPSDSHFPEDWIGSVVRANNVGLEHLADEGLSRVSVGGREMFLKDLIDRDPVAFFGRDDLTQHAEAPFLAKLLDSSIRLHVQAHPTRAFAQRHLNADHGKAEGYVILETRPEVSEPFVYIGFQRPPTRDAYRRAILEQDIDAILAPFERIAVRPGDVFFVPGGLPHAIGPGVLMLEVMEPSDLAVRLEFERGGYVLPESARFMGRGVDLALDMIDFEARSVERVRRECFGRPEPREVGGSDSRRWSLIDERLTDRFRVEGLEIDREMIYRPRGFEVFLAIQGDGEMIGDGRSIRLSRGCRGVIRAGTGPFCLRASRPGLRLLVVGS